MSSEFEKDLKEILRNIALTGSASEEKVLIKPIIGNSIEDIINNSSGLPRIKYRLVKQFKLILSHPLLLSVLNPFEIRCCLCKKVISYPCWYMNVRFNVNWFHYFVCFDSSSNTKVTARCFRR
jgi:hypothetical protein